MPHELWPNRIFTVDQLPSRSRVSSLCRPLRRGPPTAGVLLLGSVSDHGLRSVDLPRKPSRYRGVPSLPAGETLPVHTENLIRRSNNAMQHCYIRVVWLVHLSFGFLNVADFKGIRAG